MKASEKIQNENYRQAVLERIAKGHVEAVSMDQIVQEYAPDVGSDSDSTFDEEDDSIMKAYLTKRMAEISESTTTYDS